MLTDDSTSSVALPEVPLLAVLPGTGGLTRVTDKRKVRRDLRRRLLLDRGGREGQAGAWTGGLVDEVVPNSKFDETVRGARAGIRRRLDQGRRARGIALTPLDRTFGDDGSVTYSMVEVHGWTATAARATITINGPEGTRPADMDAFHAEGAQAWMLRAARELDDAILHLRLNELELGLLVFRTQGDPRAGAGARDAAAGQRRATGWRTRCWQYWKRVLKRIDMTSRSLVALVEHGSCFAGVLAEILWAVDRSYMMEDEFEGDNRPLAAHHPDRTPISAATRWATA